VEGKSSWLDRYHGSHPQRVAEAESPSKSSSPLGPLEAGPERRTLPDSQTPFWTDERERERERLSCPRASETGQQQSMHHGSVPPNSGSAGALRFQYCLEEPASPHDDSSTSSSHFASISCSEKGFMRRGHPTNHGAVPDNHLHPPSVRAARRSRPNNST